MDWSNKKFHYKIIDKNGQTIASIYKFLKELEDFAKESNIEIERLERTGLSSFDVYIRKKQGWKI